jgi:hypothetical protein
VSIAQQTATATPVPRTRPSRPTLPFDAPKRGRVVAKIAGLIALAAAGAAAAAGLVGLALLLVLVHIGA